MLKFRSISLFCQHKREKLIKFRHFHGYRLIYSKNPTFIEGLYYKNYVFNTHQQSLNQGSLPPLPPYR